MINHVELDHARRLYAICASFLAVLGAEGEAVVTTHCEFANDLLSAINDIDGMTPDADGWPDYRIVERGHNKYLTP